MDVAAGLLLARRLFAAFLGIAEGEMTLTPHNTNLFRGHAETTLYPVR